MAAVYIVCSVVLLLLSGGGFRTLTMAQPGGFRTLTMAQPGECDAVIDFIKFGLLGTTCKRAPSGQVPDNTIRFSVPSQWADICRKVKESADCLSTMSEKDASIPTISIGGAHLVLAAFPYFRSDDYRVSSLYQFPAQVCEDGHLKSDVMKYTNANLSCLTQNEIRTFYTCFENLDCKVELQLFIDRPRPGSAEILSRTTAMSVEALKCMKDVHDNANCDAETKKFIGFLAKLQIYSILDADKLEESVFGSSGHLESMFMMVMTLQFAAFYLALAK